MSDVLVELKGGKAVVVGEVDPGIAALRRALDRNGEALCYCLFCQRQVVSKDRHCPECGTPMWGSVALPEDAVVQSSTESRPKRGCR